MSPSAPKYAEAIASEWLRRVQAEYTSAARTSVFTHWLIQLGASPDLIRAGLRIVDDELAHAELSHAVVLDAQGHAGADKRVKEISSAFVSDPKTRQLMVRTLEELRYYWGPDEEREGKPTPFNNAGASDAKDDGSQPLSGRGVRR